MLDSAAIGDLALVVALAPALRRLPALETLSLSFNPLGDEGLAALVAPPPPGVLPPPTGVLAKLKALFLNNTQVSDVGCAALAAVLDNRARCRHSLDILDLSGIPASAAAMGPPRRWR